MSEEIRRNHLLAEELYRGLCQNIWRGPGEIVSLRPAEAAALVARIRTNAGCPEESASDYLGLPGEGQISPWTRRQLRHAGYHFIADGHQQADP